MAKGYWIARVDVDDLDLYQQYIAANAAPFAQYGARFLVRAGEFECVEGTSRSRNVVIEFPSYEDAKACYASEAYQHAKSLRAPVATSDLVIVQGYDA